MKFSVIVPCYNQAQYLFGLLDNVAMTTRHEHEVIIINDGSTKARTKEMIDRLMPAGAHQKIVVIHQKNKGLASTRNIGINKAKGEFIQFLDSDDVLVTGKLDRQADLMERDHLDIAIDEYVLADDDLCDITPSHDVVGSYEITAVQIARKWERGMSIPIHCPLIRRKSLGKLRFAEGARAKEDFIFWLQFFAEPRQYAFTGIVGAIYRVHAASMTRADNTGSGFQWLNAIREIGKRVPEAFDEQTTSEALDHFNRFYLRFFYEKDARFNKNVFGVYLQNVLEESGR